ncbi:TPR-like protein [Papiliotrema laurentii]|uniref:TPR-like protein n=1 Tax=Papiliotrema laurentii TaxID=5418 RepID=A0AAD9FTN9_PAPLA|nr:TPR-like protein [Papiliotrema laurentii]
MASISRSFPRLLTLARHSPRLSSRTYSTIRSSTHLARLPTSYRSPRWASSTSESSTPHDPTLAESINLLENGTAALEQGDLEGARKLYKQSVEVKPTSGGYFNLGVCEYHLNNHSAAIEAWEKSIELEPSADAYTNLASAYVMSKPPQPALAIKHLTAALKLAPEDAEIAFNLAAILESTDNLEPALKLYEKALQGGIERAAQNVRSVSAKILAKGSASAPSS